MSKYSKGLNALPNSILSVLERTGKNIQIARKRRRIPLREMSKRTMVSIPTLRKVESGNPSVSLGIFLQILWVLQLHFEFESLTTPEKDTIGKQLEEQRLPKRVHPPKPKINLDF